MSVQVSNFAMQKEK